MSDDTRSRHGGAGATQGPEGDDAGWQALISGTGPTPAVTPAAPAAPSRSRERSADEQRQPRSRREAREQEQDPATLLDPVLTPTTAPSRAQRRTQYSDAYPEREKKKRGAGIGCLVIVLVLVGVAVGGWFALQGPINQFIASTQPAADYSGSGSGSVVVSINDGDIGDDIAKTLHKQGVTASYDAFYDLLLKTKPDPVFQPGSYQLKSKMSSKSALAALQDPANKLENTVAVPEGTAAADIYPLVAAALKVPVADVTAAAATPATYGLPAQATTLEGFLFPATYKFDPGTTPQQALKTMVDRSFKALDDAGVAPGQRWNTVVLAALVQREAGLKDDYYKVSRVFLNRLDPAQWDSGLLQSDATVAYGTGQTDRVTTTDAERADSSNPYNTYVHPGLPPGPISNPGDLAIDAALHPADGPWLYFVTWNLDTGETIFSTTSDEHDAAVQKWLDWMDAHPEYK